MSSEATSVGVCAVVGVGPGLGKSVALKFASKGYAIALLSRKESSADSAVAALKELGATFKWTACDVSDEDSVKSAFAIVRETLGNVDCLVYNAGGMGFGPSVMEAKYDDLLLSFKVSCGGAM